MSRKKIKISFERALNETGYYYLSNNQLDNAISIFRLLTEEHSNSSNTFDSLAEAYFIKKQYDLALENYNKEVELGGTDGNAKAMIEKIKSILKSNKLSAY
jgi:tetratricopeptide (TPR) repeat protein